ncbi:NAD(P)-dependent oxidoreductase [Ferrimonas balearica]|uniref:NAD-dependent epimerase/dehydratase family protein n=1 Tax=Ferrimonas balearica TaxID=44012 RepID=UPI001C583B35|nr:NAD(P)-dependent oxidoreductase [Ferrimonas balearica]MBW3139295.1 NAD(P)-dependent oxidoreductase [Ferrimonas balearica]MBY6106359.1 NAD(P)-dependent oxidoreductase [Ferrimonas balearica]
MRHIILGGDGFLGTELCKKLIARQETVVIADIKRSEDSPIYQSPLVSYIPVDVCQADSLKALEVTPEDHVYHFAARLLVPILPRAQRQSYFWTVLYQGTENVLNYLKQRGAKRLIYFTTDMVYGHTREHPRTESHPRVPLGPYGEAKYQSELLCERYRQEGFDITIFRPRLIIGPGRLGILEKLFKLIDMNLPVPTIGSGNNHYQFISVSDCAEACLAAIDAGYPNRAFNLGSANPPPVNVLLRQLIVHAQSRSFLVPTPAFLVKAVLAGLDQINSPLMDPEQYLIADETCVLDIQAGKRELGWEPQDNDQAMLIAAYDSYRSQQQDDPDLERA